MSPLIVARVEELLPLSLKRGSHEANEREFCVMEAVAYVAGEPWSDAPPCACPVLGAFLRNWNDSLPDDATRDRLLKPLVQRLVDTKSTPAVESRRSYLALDWLVRVHTPKWLDLVPSLAQHASALRDLEEIADMAGATAAGKRTAAARDAAWDAARDAAWDAALAAAGDAALAAAGAAALDAAWDAALAAAGDAAGDAALAAAGDAALAAAWDAALAAAWDAALAAAWAAARDALKPTTEWLQASALDLVDRMIAVQP